MGEPDAGNITVRSRLDGHLHEVHATAMGADRRMSLMICYGTGEYVELADIAVLVPADDDF